MKTPLIISGDVTLMREEGARAVSSSDIDLVRRTGTEMAQSLKGIPLQLRTGEPSEDVRAFGESWQKKLPEHTNSSTTDTLGG